MEISKKGEYALRALMYLARNYSRGVVKIRDIAQEASIPQPFLEQILLQLKNARILESVKGAGGGYRLKRPPSEINLGEIIRYVDGALAPFQDQQGLQKEIKNSDDYAGLYSVLLDVRDAVAEILDNTTLEQLLERTENIKD